MAIPKQGKFLKFDHYAMSEIKEGHIIQLVYEKTKFTRTGDSLAEHLKVKKLDPPRGRILGEPYLPSGSKTEKVFLIDEIYRNYSLDPIKSTECNHRQKKNIPFTRTPKQ